MILPPVAVIARPITELRCSVRFRYHLPGAGMKELVVTKVPPWCAAEGLGVDDRIVGVDGRPIDGQSLISFIKTIAAKVGPPPMKPTHFIFAVESKSGKTIRTLDATFDDSRNFTIAYP